MKHLTLNKTKNSPNYIHTANIVYFFHTYKNSQNKSYFLTKKGERHARLSPFL